MMHTEAGLDGWHAHKNAVALTANPYDGARQTQSYFHWILGWTTRADTLKAGGDLSLDATLRPAT